MSKNRISAVACLFIAASLSGAANCNARGPNPPRVTPTIFAPLAKKVLLGIGFAAGQDLWQQIKLAWNQPAASTGGNGFAPPMIPNGVASPWQAPPTLPPLVQTQWRHGPTGQVFVLAERGNYVMLYTTNPNIRPALVGLGYRVNNVIHFKSIGSPGNVQAAGQAILTRDANGVWWFRGHFRYPNRFGGPQFINVHIYRVR